jgi:4-amino-4-deoxy-L-arabinose transferase-like glycosyltransferase
LGAVTIWATWRIALEILPTEPWLALGAVSFVAFLPGFVTLSAVVNNDNLVIALSHLGVWQLIRMMHAPRRVRDEILLGGILGLALLAKLNASALWIFAAIVLGWRAYQTRTWRNGALTFGWCFGIALALGSPWMFYNLRTYGDPLGWSLYQVVGTLRPTPMTFNEWLVVIPQLVTSFWGRPGGMLNIHLPNELYIALTVLATVSLVGWVQFLRNAELDFARRARRSLALFAAFWVPMLIVYVQWASNDYAPDQARRLFPGLGLLAIILVVGFTRPAGDRKHIALAVWISGFFTLTVGVLVYLHLSYAVVPQNLARLEPLGGIGTPADFGGTIRIADFRVAPRRVIAGERINVQVYWQAIQSPQENYWMSLQLGGTEGAIANQDGVPSAGRLTTDWWLQDQVFVSHHSITVPADARAGKYTLRLGLHPYGKWEWLSVRGGDMLTLAGIEVIEQ